MGLEVVTRLASNRNFFKLEQIIFQFELELEQKPRTFRTRTSNLNAFDASLVDTKRDRDPSPHQDFPSLLKYMELHYHIGNSEHQAMP